MKPLTWHLPCMFWIYCVYSMCYHMYICSTGVFSQVMFFSVCFCQRCIERRLNMKTCLSSRFLSSSLSTSTRLQFTSPSSKAGENHCFCLMDWCRHKKITQLQQQRDIQQNIWHLMHKEVCSFVCSLSVQVCWLPWKVQHSVWSSQRRCESVTLSDEDEDDDDDKRM